MSASLYFRYNQCSVENLEFEQQTNNHITSTKGAGLDAEITERKYRFPNTFSTTFLV